MSPLARLMESVTVDRAQKSEAVSELSEIADTSGVIVVAQYGGMTVAEMSDLRSQMREGGARFKVAKNRLVKIALDGKPQEVAKDLFKGQTGIAFSEDPVSASKIAIDYAKKNEKFEILGGVLGGQLLDKDGVKALADMPSIDELRAKLLGTLKAPLAKFAGVLKAPPQKMAGVLKAPPQKLIGVLKAYEAKQNAGEAA
ncbi:MAG: 50S ribosomal protein L10 [Pseudomonadota bacterium]